MDLLYKVELKFSIFLKCLNFEKLIIHLSRSNPCTKVCVWNSTEIQTSVENLEEIENRPSAKKLNYIQIQSIVKTHRAVEIDLNPIHEKSICRCVGIVETYVTFWNLEGPCNLKFVRLFDVNPFLNNLL